MFKEENKNRLKFLAGINVINENVSLVANTAGRSDSNTLSFYVEGYLLNLTELIINTIEDVLKNKGIQISISKKNTKISENSIATQLIINNREFLLTLLVSFEQGSNTSASLTSNGQTENFNLNSQHNNNDVNLFIKEIVQRLLGVLNIQ